VSVQLSSFFGSYPVSGENDVSSLPSRDLFSLLKDSGRLRRLDSRRALQLLLVSRELLCRSAVPQLVHTRGARKESLIDVSTCFHKSGWSVFLRIFVQNTNTGARVLALLLSNRVPFFFSIWTLASPSPCAPAESFDGK